MAERTAEPVDETLRRDAVARLLKWGFSRTDIAATLGQSEAWVREVQEAQPIDDSPRSTSLVSPITDHTTTE